MIRRPPRSTQSRSSAASDVYKRQIKSYRMFLKGIRQRHAAFHILTHLTNYLTKPRIGRLLFKNVEPAQKCESRIDHRCKLAGEDHLVMHLDLCETFQEVIDLRKPLLLLEAHDCQSLA